jgi:hypothetical protein
MAENREKPIYSITLKSEEDDEVTVIDRFHKSPTETTKLFLIRI